MNLEKKKNLAAKTLGVGKDRITFSNERLLEIKEAITRQDIRDLHANKSILIKEINGRKSKQRRKTRRRKGSIKKRLKHGKRKYIAITRKLRKYINELFLQNKITREQYLSLRKQIKTSAYRSKSHLKEALLLKNGAHS